MGGDCHHPEHIVCGSKSPKTRVPSEAGSIVASTGTGPARWRKSWRLFSLDKGEEVALEGNLQQWASGRPDPASDSIVEKGQTMASVLDKEQQH